MENPITPPSNLVEAWYASADNPDEDVIKGVAVRAARWGADQELEACCKWLCAVERWKTVADRLRSNRRPKPPSLKEQAKFAAAVLRSPDETCSIAELQQHWHTICNALEQLND